MAAASSAFYSPLFLFLSHERTLGLKPYDTILLYFHVFRFLRPAQRHIEAFESKKALGFTVMHA